MKAYGIPRNDDVANPDKADCGTYGLKSSYTRTDGKSGQKSHKKRSTRRIWKRAARRENRAACDSF